MMTWELKKSMNDHADERRYARFCGSRRDDQLKLIGNGGESCHWGPGAKLNRTRIANTIQCPRSAHAVSNPR
jgi:hypothetical protein